MVRTLLIDDEPGARAELRWLLEAHPAYTVVGEAATFDQGAHLLRSAEYELVLLDIQLLGGTGFDLVPHVRSGARIVFITAYDQHALRAFEVNALDYLLKPASTERFASALARLALPPVTSALSPTPRRARIDDQVLLKLDSATERFVPIARIRSIESCENYTEVTLIDGERLLVRRTMKAWEDFLPTEYFGRVHRLAIVAYSQIERIVRINRATFEVCLNGHSAPMPVSYRLVSDLRERLGARWPAA